MKDSPVFIDTNVLRKEMEGGCRSAFRRDKVWCTPDLIAAEAAPTVISYRYQMQNPA